MKSTRGRKPIDESLKKASVILFLEKYKIESFGGIEKCKEYIYECINKKSKDKKDQQD